MQDRSVEIERLEVFKEAERLCDEIWESVSHWDEFARNTVGRQLVRAADSIGANLVEGDGRQHARDSLNFFYFARASLREARYWLTRAEKRKLFNTTTANDFLNRSEYLLRLVNGFIASRQKQLPMLRETTETYASDVTDDLLPENALST